MKITIHTGAEYAETEIIILSASLDGKAEKILGAIRSAVGDSTASYEKDEKSESPPKLIGVKNGQQHIIDPALVVFIDTADKRAFIYTDDACYESPLRLYELEDTLKPRGFLRASKTALYNFNRIQSIEPDLDRRMILTMENDMKVLVSRQYSPDLKRKLEVFK